MQELSVQISTADRCEHDDSLNTTLRTTTTSKRRRRTRNGRPACNSAHGGHRQLQPRLQHRVCRGRGRRAFVARRSGCARARIARAAAGIARHADATAGARGAALGRGRGDAAQPPQGQHFECPGQCRRLSICLSRMCSAPSLTQAHRTLPASSSAAAPSRRSMPAASRS
jgi:hypothetical protein